MENYDNFSFNSELIGENYHTLNVRATFTFYINILSYFVVSDVEVTGHL